jgi:hypothetical protein
MKTLLSALCAALCILIQVDFGLAVTLVMHGLILNVLMLMKIAFLMFTIAKNVVCKKLCTVVYGYINFSH